MKEEEKAEDRMEYYFVSVMNVYQENGKGFRIFINIAFTILIIAIAGLLLTGQLAACIGVMIPGYFIVRWKFICHKYEKRPVPVAMTSYQDHIIISFTGVAKNNQNVDVCIDRDRTKEIGFSDQLNAVLIGYVNGAATCRGKNFRFPGKKGELVFQVEEKDYPYIKEQLVRFA